MLKVYDMKVRVPSMQLATQAKITMKETCACPEIVLNYTLILIYSFGNAHPVTSHV